MAVVKIVVKSTAIPSVPVASAVVIFVITPLVSTPCEYLAFLTTFLLRWIQTRALATVQKRCCSQFLVCFSATVSTVPITAALIVAVVTSAIALPCFDGTLRYTSVVAREEGIAAATIRAKIVIIASSTTVSTIPAAATVVVVVVADPVLPEREHRARSVAVDPRVLACAVCAVLVALVGATAIASVPSATTNIIPVVTIFVALPGLDARLSVRLRFARTFFSLLLFVARAVAPTTITAKLRL